MGIILLVLAAAPAQVYAQAFDYGSLWRSLLVPGSGQAHQGHYKKAAVFAGATILSAAGVFLTSVQYNQAVDSYDTEKGIYNSYAEDLANGNVVRIDDVNATYNAMSDAWDDAEGRFKWRNGFIVALAATYTLNIVDILISKPHDPDTAMNYGVDATKERVLVVRSWRF